MSTRKPKKLEKLPEHVTLAKSLEDLAVKYRNSDDPVVEIIIKVIQLILGCYCSGPEHLIELGDVNRKLANKFLRHFEEEQAKKPAVSRDTLQ